jgi:hypothetical protein
MSELRSAIEVLRAEILSELPDARLEEDFAEIQRVGELLELERLRRLAELERRRSFERDGHLSAASWLASQFKVGWGQAKDSLRTARALEEMPETRKALEEGDVSLSGVKVLVQARETDPEEFGRSEATLVEAARIHSTGDLQKVAAYWRQAVEYEHALESNEKVRARRRLHASVSFLGMVRVDGDLDPETGETLLTALRAVLDAEAKSTGGNDERTPGQRRADAMGEICRQFLDRSDRPSVGGERPHVTLTVGIDALRSGGRPSRAAPDTNSELDHVGPVDPQIAPANGLRCLTPTGRDVRAVRAPGRRTPSFDHPAGNATGSDHPRSPLPLPRVRPAAHVVRRAPRDPLGRGWPDGSTELAPALPTSPPDGPPAGWLPVGTR